MEMNVLLSQSLLHQVCCLEPSGTTDALMRPCLNPFFIRSAVWKGPVLVPRPVGGVSIPSSSGLLFGRPVMSTRAPPMRLNPFFIRSAVWNHIGSDLARVHGLNPFFIRSAVWKIWELYEKSPQYVSIPSSSGLLFGIQSAAYNRGLDEVSIPSSSGLLFGKQ